MGVKASPGSFRQLGAFVLSLLLPLAVSCGTLEVGVEGTVTPGQAATESVRPSEPAATLSVTPTPTATPVPTLTGTPVPISILSFDVSPAEIWPGDPVTLTWNVVAEWVAIYSLDSEGRLSEPWFTVPLSGTLVATTNASLRNRARFVLFAGSGDSREQAMAFVNITCPDEWFFSSPPADCPGPPHHTTIVAERFERGLMLWLEAAGEIHIFNEIVILYDNDAASPRWQMMLDGWSPGMPEQDPDIVPPPGYYEPVRGFGKVWREVPGVRDRLGWAIEEEFVVGDGAFQCTWGRYAQCYLTGPDGAIYVLEPEMSGWSVVE